MLGKNSAHFSLLLLNLIDDIEHFLGGVRCLRSDSGFVWKAAKCKEECFCIICCAIRDSLPMCTKQKHN